jgi:hypothetical protein
MASDLSRSIVQSIPQCEKYICAYVGDAKSKYAVHVNRDDVRHKDAGLISEHNSPGKN